MANSERLAGAAIDWLLVAVAYASALAEEAGRHLMGSMSKGAAAVVDLAAVRQKAARTVQVLDRR